MLEAVRKHLSDLGLEGAVSLLTTEGSMEIRARWMSAALSQSLERLAGLSIEGFRFDPDEVGVYREVFARREAVFHPRRAEFVRQLVPAALQPMFPVIMRLLGEQPIVVAPLLLMGEPIGAINVNAAWLGPDHARVLSLLADHVAIALGHVRARSAMAASLERERLHNQIAEAIASELELPALLERVIQLAVETLYADAGAIALVDPQEATVSYPYLFGLPDNLRTMAAEKGQGLAWRLIEGGAPIRLDDYPAHPQALREWVEAGVHAFLGVPLIVGGEAVGALGMFRKSAGSTFSAGDVETAQALARLAAIAVKNAQLYTRTKQLADQSQALIRTSHSISASLELDTVLKLIAEQARELLGADGSRIHLIDFEAQVLHCLIALDPSAASVTSIELKLGEGLVGEVARSGEAILSNAPADDPRSVHIPGTPEDEPESLAIAPLRTRQRTIGTMTVRRIGTKRPFEEADLDLLTGFAAQAALAIENADLYGQIETQALQLEEEVRRQTHDLALSEARYRALVETSLAGFFQLDLQGRITYVSQSLADMLERTRDEVLGTHGFGFLMPVHEAEATKQHLARVRGEAPPREVSETVLLSKNDKRIPCLVAVSLVNDPSGRPRAVTGLVVDISKTKALEAELRAERDRLQAILTNIADAVVVMDPAGRIEYVNPAWEELTGYSSEASLGKELSILQSGLLPEPPPGEMEEALRRGASWQGERLNRRMDGSVYDVAVSITPVLDDDGQVVSFVGVQHDISSLKEVERLKSQFVSEVSHELRTPLTNIRLYTDLLQASKSQPRVDTYLKTLTRESERLSFLIDDLLSLSGLDAGATPYNPRRLRINQILEALVEDRQELAAQRGLKLTFIPDPEHPEVLGDRRLLTQVFTNLLSNAMGYTTSPGSIQISTSFRARQGREWIVIEFADDGVGIAPEELPLIFGRFFRGEASRVTSAPGTGLGLAICREILALHDGEITVTSAPGEGSRFLVWLPADGAAG